MNYESTFLPKAMYEFTNLRFRLRIYWSRCTNLRIFSFGYEFTEAL